MMRLTTVHLLLAVSLTTVTESKRHREDDNKQCSDDICNLGDKCVLKCFCDTRLNATDCFLFNGNISSTSEIWDTFSNKPYLQTLSLKVTGTVSLKEIPTRAIQRIDNLKNLTIKFAPIQRLPYNAFANSKSLREIYLIRNQISRLDTFSISRLPNLVVLNLEENEISELQQEVFVHLPSLKKLSLSFNNLTLIHEACFKNLTNLLELNLHANDISTLTRENFQGLVHLETLDLSRNELKMLGNYVFAETKYLKNLILGENKLIMIAEMAFNGLLRLEKLSLENNKLLTIEPRLLRGMPRLIAVDLRSNRLSNISNETVSPVIHNIDRYGKGALKLDGNPFTCDCGLSWTHHVVKTTTSDHLRHSITNVSCLADRDLSQLLVGVISTQPPKQIRGKIYYNIVEDDANEEEIKEVKVVDIPLDMLPCPVHLRAKDTVLEPTLNEIRNNPSSASMKGPAMWIGPLLLSLIF